ncbi:MAG TPA: thermonuclease family protein [Rhizobiaceae bacterium]|nr:thermonuclease family protein [Rhizobiaceae bacterium]
MNHPVRIVVLAFCGLCLVLGIWLGGRVVIEAQNSKSAKLGAPQSLSPSGMPGQKMSPTLEHKEVRRVTQGEKDGSVVSSDLERRPPRSSLRQPPAKPAEKSEVGNTTSKTPAARADPNQRKETILYQPVATAAGVLDASGYHVTLAGIDPVGKDESCRRSTGGTWPCGLVARTAFRAWLRGRAMTCNVPSAKGVVTTSCKIGDDDPALWLAENGWAKSEDPRYSDAVAKAKEGKRGVFGDPPKAYSAMPALPQPPLPEIDGDGGEETR